MWNITGHNRGPAEILWQILSGVRTNHLLLSFQFQRELLLNLWKGVKVWESLQSLPVWRIHFSAVQQPCPLWEVANTLSTNWHYEFFLLICLRKDTVHFSLPSASCSLDYFSACPIVFSHFIFQTFWSFLFSSFELTLLFGHMGLLFALACGVHGSVSSVVPMCMFCVGIQPHWKDLRCPTDRKDLKFKWNMGCSLQM